MRLPPGHDKYRFFMGGTILPGQTEPIKYKSSYEIHRQLCSKGKKNIERRKTVSIYGDREIMTCWTPEGLRDCWEALYIDRIRFGEKDEIFKKEIKSSPLTKDVIQNLLKNIQIRSKKK